MTEFQHNLAGINDFANSINGIYNCEMYRIQSYYRKGKQAIPQPGSINATPDSPNITSNADWWITERSKGGATKISDTAWTLTDVAGNTSALVLNADGTIHMCHVMDNARYQSYINQGMTEDNASKLAGATYYFCQRPDNKMTSIAAYAEKENVTEGGFYLRNNSWLDRQVWNEAPHLGEKHTILWRFHSFDPNDAASSTHMTIRCQNNPQVPGSYECTLYQQYHAGEAKPLPETFKSTQMAFGVNIVFDEVDRAVCIPETNTILVNPNHQYCWARVELWPSDHNNKRETDDSSEISLK